MECKVQGLYKNPRYRFLIIGEETYILDMGRSFWKILFPFFFWIFPNSIFKVNDQDIVEKLGVQKAKSNTVSIGLLGGGIGIFLGNLLSPLMDYFDIQSNPFVNSIFVIIMVILMFLLRFYINNKNKKNLYQVAKLEQLSTARLWIRPKSIKHFFQVLWIYFFILSLTVLGFALFIELGNIMALFFAAFCLILVLIVSKVTVKEGNTTVKFKVDKKTVV